MEPSPVLHIRNLPPDVDQEEVFSLAERFGGVRNCLLMRVKNQALLEMNDVGVATAMVASYTASPPILRGKTIYVQYSKHKELRKQGSSSSTMGHTPSHVSPAVMGYSVESLSPVPREQEMMPNKILRVIVDNMQYRVDLEAIHQIFSKYGVIDKMITFKKNEVYSALVQFQSIQEAAAAKQNLNGLNVYTGCCKLRISYSTQYDLEIKEESDKARDFTRSRYVRGSDLDPKQMDLSPRSGRSVYDDRERGILGRGCDRLPRESRYSYGLSEDFDRRPPPSSSRRYSSDYMDRPPSPSYNPPRRERSVLLVSNLDENIITPEILFTLFGVYGNICRVKILFNKKDTALVQMGDEYQAETAIRYLSGATLYGKRLNVVYSKHSSVEMPREDTAGLTKDYTDSKLNRFFKPGSKNFQNIFPPSATLHLSNIGVEISDEAMIKLFTDRGLTVEAFRFFVKDKRMALIRLASVEEGMKGLIEMHNHELDKGHHLRVSFTKSTIQD